MATFDLLADIKSLLTGVTSDIYKNEMPETPVNVIAIYNSPGFDPIHVINVVKPAYEQPGFQVVVRHSTAGTARTWIEAIKNALDGQCNLTINSHLYLSIFQQGDVLPMGREASTHAIEFSLNFLTKVVR
jgi:hypothetical protein